MGSYYAGMMNSGYGPALRHYRTEGSQNGIRLYQYENGSLTPLGREHYGVGEAKESTESQAKSMIDSWKKTVNDEGTVQELEAIERKLKTGAMSEEEAMAEATTAVQLDKERAENKNKKAKKGRSKKQKASKQSRKQRDTSEQPLVTKWRASSTTSDNEIKLAKRTPADHESSNAPLVTKWRSGPIGNKLSLARSGR